ncbi:acyl-CoA carboxylase subunit epsilon [Streptomyces laculatispora]|uniref:acyl-CoA carboxylase subunit epsilon n=1 Tax=Streptomyces laculatispora TaxID=887464 RepID=UPI001A94868D|nr:acyl-CoA carboxylase subunit epsilon [Streptomyces laculatispora]MBO0913756.1 acyl-CoA carboxylase subunit epsilon [Streptomyces laculatispora]
MPLIRVEKGTPQAEDLVALTAVLLSRGRAALGPDADRRRTFVPWSRAGNPTACPTPRSWRT